MKNLFLILALLMSSVVSAQQPVTWENLSEIKWKTVYDPINELYYDIPQHSQSIKKLNNKEIIIQGFYVPIDTEGKYFALSATPSTMCFFCNVGGIESVMEIRVKKDHAELKRIKVDKYIELKGRFKLNMKVNEYLMYILEDAELVKVIK